MLEFIGNVSLANVTVTTANANSEEDTVTKVICNVINFVQGLGLPIMTGVILGSSIMAIFGKLPWPAIVMLVVFTAIFFGAGKIMVKFANGVGAGGKECTSPAPAAAKVIVASLQ
ncbi:hypothetical protein EDL79_04275 [Ehrlichia ruminantium]|uniref:TrbC/VIRB2 family protein n=2 Tax=Ehrlichia ruminantium TaxID=779 RepID=A0AAE6Q9L1_EHRRU|nr:TrbC/VirB2 family protein [Ehrlichia ruminantium]QGR02827.1 hypothetical protein EDL81_04255 [Ehrlichia ruminantium]QGR03751.1 hypothetical protein EDL80_04265 [Ehrlichia ruminantium]QGR04678.1 hypothetical protein EDL79_04275 [Ehrlichia ruminantium]